MNDSGIDKAIIISESIGVPRLAEPVRVGVPFARGELREPASLAVCSPAGMLEPVQAAALSRWHDGSVKWALVDFAATVPAGTETVYRLVTAGQRRPEFPTAIAITPGSGTWVVNTGVAEFTIDTETCRPFAAVRGLDGTLLGSSGDCLLTTAEGDVLKPMIDTITLEAAGPFHALVSLAGRFGAGEGGLLRFACRLHFHAGSSRTVVELTLHNPRPALHPGGLWDLGDPGSVLFRELALTVRLPMERVSALCCSPAPGMEPLSGSGNEASLAIYQESSGGERWRSPTHRTRNGMVPFALNGYEVLANGRQVAVGRRATPVVWGGAAGVGVAAVLPCFWQEFPKALEINRHELKVSFFPARFPDLHELQGGEQKTHSFHLDFAAAADHLDWARAPLAVVAAPAVVRQSRIFVDLPGGDAGSAEDLVDRFIGGPEEFIRKREQGDEYGWRNFGELYADHEAVFHQGEEPFVSHYNNQYDCCAGMYRKALASGDLRWDRLAAELARHLLDIDIYHTTDDREEYNNGLFWHTDHYVPAGLATHRSFSREQCQGKDPRFCGGGPGAEHCYTSGLLLHYYLTGDRVAAEAVVALAEWCYRSLSGPQTVLAALKRSSRHLNRLRTAGENKVAFPRYPLSRGTGNAVNACLDAFALTGEEKFVARAEELIRGSLHPDDDLAARELHDPESSWSYTVLLVAVAKYLDTLKERGEFSNGFAYARASLLAYAAWMAEQEYPYLEKPEILEYPNETWAAQDLRKSVVLYHAARYCDGDRRAVFLDRSRYFFQTAGEELARHQTSRYTRPVALMLQNGWVGPRSAEQLAPCLVPAEAADGFGKPTPYFCGKAVLVRICHDLARAIRETSWRREIAWLTSRLPVKQQ
ncbi:hypothetical protein GURASL_19760 [Geotalea uraniireducens]|uniref:PcRGLX/YetA-like N-terminal RIFT barrel domain-containing protein n=1 Tax=Geotalea uraniireducens TaxID=351604 RepID=A0ABN6VRQ4_9BACT|nr:hypothetical protein [Geotalea uraniireducens]BDV43053.1 hypothetical protein GURASL_19760 [Geotalea uraniireducens]